MTLLAEPARRAAPEAITRLRAAAGYLHRADLRCPVHRVAHTGKLARAIVLDVCLYDATGDTSSWQRAVERARYVASRLAPDPEHGALIFLPGRLDPRNCSNSVIDSGECTGALARLLRHPQAVSLDGDVHRTLWSAVEQNAETYLRSAVVEKEITNQRLWGAMGLAAAWSLNPRPEWLDALRRSLERSAGEQRRDGSWGYQTDAAAHGAFEGAADLTVYYHSRCLAFMESVLRQAPESDPSGAGRAALERGLRFLAAVIAPDGLKPLALEGKRWFWDGSYEAGSAAYDVYALLRGAALFDRPEWRRVAARCWRRLMAHQRVDGAIVACPDRGAHDFVCQDFHTADLAWPAEVLGEVLALAGEDRDTVEREAAAGDGVPLEVFADAGVVRLESAARTALVRTRKLAANTQFGGAASGLVSAHDAAGERLLWVTRERATVEGSFTVYPHLAALQPVSAVRRFFRGNPLRREGRQWLFVGRLLLRQGRPFAAAARVWRGYIAPLLESIIDPAATHWTTVPATEDGATWLRLSGTPARRDGSVPAWLGNVTSSRHVRAAGDELHMVDQIGGGAGTGRAGRVVYTLPRGARHVDVVASGCVTRRSGQSVVAAPDRRPWSLRVTYTL